jgi:hypothetical protein
MSDYAKSLGLAHNAVLVALLKTLMGQKALSKKDVRTLLESAGQSLLSKKTEIATVATEHIRLLGEEVGVAPDQIDAQTNTEDGR